MLKAHRQISTMIIDYIEGVPTFLNNLLKSNAHISSVFDTLIRCNMKSFQAAVGSGLANVSVVMLR
jgi:hypothetical protein